MTSKEKKGLAILIDCLEESIYKQMFEARCGETWGAKLFDKLERARKELGLEGEK